MLSFGGYLKEPKPILWYALDECVNKRGPGKFGAIPQEEKCRRKQLLN